MTFSSRKTVCSLTIPFMLSFLLAGCTFMQLREETEIIQHSTILVGNVTSTPSFREMPVVVTAYSKEKNKRTIVHYTTLHEPGSYELIVPKGIYYIVAFGDKNKNLIYNKGEPVGQHLGGEPLSAPLGGVVTNLDIVISSLKTGKIDFPIGSVMPPKKTKTFDLWQAEHGSSAWKPVKPLSPQILHANA